MAMLEPWAANFWAMTAPRPLWLSGLVVRGKGGFGFGFFLGKNERERD